MAGSKVLFMDDPDRIQAMGAMIDYKKYSVTDLYHYSLDDGTVNEAIYCDYVPACSLMVKTEALHKTGLMPEENFIYYDDMDWGVRFNLAGYKVAAVPSAKVWHKGGGKVSGTTFNKYYMFRNRICFFMKYLKNEEKESFARYILDELYRSVCACYLKKIIQWLKLLCMHMMMPYMVLQAKQQIIKLWQGKTVNVLKIWLKTNLLS